MLWDISYNFPARGVYFLVSCYNISDKMCTDFLPHKNESSQYGEFFGENNFANVYTLISKNVTTWHFMINKFYGS